MPTLAIHRETSAIALPPPRGGAISIREAELKDVPFIDQLQRKHSRLAYLTKPGMPPALSR